MASHRGAEGERTGADGRRREQDAEGWAAGHRGSRGLGGWPPREQRAGGTAGAEGRRQEQAAGAPATGGAEGGRDSRVASTGPAAAVNFP